MTQITLNIEDPKMLPMLRKLFRSMNGISIANTGKKRKTELQKRIENLNEEDCVSFDTKEERESFLLSL